MVDEKQIEQTEKEKDKAFVEKLANKFTPRDLIRETRFMQHPVIRSAMSRNKTIVGWSQITHIYPDCGVWHRSNTKHSATTDQINPRVIDQGWICRWVPLKAQLYRRDWNGNC